MSVSRLLSRARWRRLVVLPVLGALVGVIAGCDRPTPLVTMQSGSSFVQANAANYERDGVTIKDDDYQPPVLRTSPGSTINIDVPKSVAETGYFLASGDTRITDVVTEQHYRLIMPSNAGQGETNLTVFQLPRPGSKQASGSWPFRLVIRS